MGLVQRMGGAFTSGIGDAFEGLARGAADSLPRLLAGVIVFAIAWLIARVASAATRRVLARTSTQAHVDLLVARTVRWAVLAVGLVTALAVLGVNVGALVTSLGLAGLTLGFALRDVLANSVAGVTLLMQRPFTIGDTILVGATEGVVRDVRVRDTVLRTPDGRLAYLPNMTVFNAVVINVSQAPVRRFEIAVWTSAGMPLEGARVAVLAAVAGTPGVLEDPAPESVVASVGPDRARIVARAWVDTASGSLGAAQSDALARARAALPGSEAETAVDGAENGGAETSGMAAGDPDA
jgi:small-conductance mechanosensitive channel